MSYSVWNRQTKIEHLKSDSKCGIGHLHIVTYIPIEIIKSNNNNQTKYKFISNSFP